MSDSKEKSLWTPPAKIEQLYEQLSGNNVFSAINRPTAGARNDDPLPLGENDYDFQLYSLATPNGQKAGIVLEELEIAYDATTISIFKGEQFGKGFVAVNPNSKIPCATDRIIVDGKPKVIRIFETGSIMIYLADKYQKFIPSNVTHPAERAECISWMMWAQIQAFVSGNYGHFFTYAPDKEVDAKNYGVNRYGMELQRLCSVLDAHLADKKFMLKVDGKDFYSIADMAIFPWIELIRTIGYKHEGSNTFTKDFLSMKQYVNLNRWADEVGKRRGVQRGMLVCRKNDFPKPWLNPEEKRFHHLLTHEERMQVLQSRM